MQKLFVFLAAFLLCSCSAAGAPPSLMSSRIIGGAEAKVGDFPYVVAITRQLNHLCSGFIYNERWIVTAASCVQEVPINELDVSVGFVSYITPGSSVAIYNVFAVQIYQEYNTTNKLHDVALLEVSRPITLDGANVDFLEYGESDESDIAAKGTIMGWGVTRNGGLPSSVLNFGEITLPGNCAVYGTSNYDSKYMVCAGTVEDTVRPCNFDEGSPLVQPSSSGSEKVVGILSKVTGLGGECGSNPYYSSIYTRLAPYYVSWLRGIAGTQPTRPSGP